MISIRKKNPITIGNNRNSHPDKIIQQQDVRQASVRVREEGPSRLHEPFRRSGESPRRGVRKFHQGGERLVAEKILGQTRVQHAQNAFDEHPILLDGRDTIGPEEPGLQCRYIRP